jgi:hypothetical protein
MKVGSCTAALDVADLVAAQRHGQVLVDGVDRDAAAHGLLGVDLEAPVVVGLGHVVVDVGDAVHLLEHLGQVGGHLAAGLGVGP